MCSSNSPDELFATPAPAWHFPYRGSNFRCLVLPATPFGWLACAPSGSQPWNNTAAETRGGSQEEKNPCNKGTCGGEKESSSV
jgi:hypothetical protein